MAKQILTLDNLYQFYLQKNETITFSSKESGKPIVVTTNGFFEANDCDMPGMLKLKLKVCHTETNRNGSHISKENMESAMPTLKYRPILAYIHELPDGTKDFYAHNIEIIENEDGESIKFTQRSLDSSSFLVDIENSDNVIIEIGDYTVYSRQTNGTYYYLWNDGKYALTLNSKEELSHETLEAIINGIKNK